MFLMFRTVWLRIPFFVFLITFFITNILLSGCERLKPIISPEDLDTTIKIGFIYSPPDPGTTRNGAEIAVALANKAGGVKGLPIELLVRDDNRDPSLSIQHSKELIAAGVMAIVGPDYSNVAVEVGAVVQEAGVPMVTTYPTNPKVTQHGNYSFMGAFIDPYQADIMANFAIQELKAMTAAILTEIGNSYSEGLSEVFRGNYEAHGGTIATHQFYNDGTTDFTVQLMKIAAVESGVDVIFLPGLGPEFPLAVKQAKSDAFGISAIFLGGDGWDRPDLVEIGGIAVEGSYFANHFSSDGPLSEVGHLFVNTYTQRFGNAPDGPASLGFDAATIIIEAMRRTTDLTPTAIREQIEATQNYNGATTLSHFDQNRHAIKSLVINTVKNGMIQFNQLIAP